MEPFPSQKSDVPPSPFPLSMFSHFLFSCPIAARPGFEWEWIFVHPASNLCCPVALAGLEGFMDLIYSHNSSVKIALWEFSEHPEQNQEFSSSFRALYNWCTWEEKRWDFFSCRLSGKVLLSHSKYQSTFHFWPLRWLADRTVVSGVCRKFRLKLITCPFHCYYRNKFG